MATESKSISVVHVDDEFLELKHVEQELQKGCDGYTFKVTSLRSLESYKDFLKTGERPDAVILDVHFVDEQKKGIDFAAKTKSRWPDTAVLIRTTDYSCVQKALKTGCEDFIGKDNFEGEISMRTIRAVERVRSTTQKFRGETPADSKVIGETMQAIENRAPRIVSSSIKAVHIRGESGTGKEVVTEIIERVAGKPFVKVNCAALQENIFDSELFGYIKGAFTGAQKDTPGLIEAADNGWLFLDEVATIPLTCQAKLLRVIDNHEYKRVGDNKTRKAKVRILSATNEDLEKMVADGRFRNDLLQRLKETEIYLPPLRERPREIKKLIEYFCSTFDGGPYKITEPTIKILCGYDWSEGNARELRNCLRAMTEHHLNKLLTPTFVPAKVLENSEVKDVNGKSSCASNDFQSNDLTIRWSGQEIPTHNALSDKLFLEMVRLIHKEKGTLPLGEMASIIGYSNRITSEKLKNLVSKGEITTEELLDITNVKVATDDSK